jgi:hypothetical protein
MEKTPNSSATTLRLVNGPAGRDWPLTNANPNNKQLLKTMLLFQTHRSGSSKSYAHGGVGDSSVLFFYCNQH